MAVGKEGIHCQLTSSSAGQIRKWGAHWTAHNVAQGQYDKHPPPAAPTEDWKSSSLLWSSASLQQWGTSQEWRASFHKQHIDTWRWSLGHTACDDKLWCHNQPQRMQSSASDAFGVQGKVMQLRDLSMCSALKQTTHYCSQRSMNALLRWALSSSSWWCTQGNSIFLRQTNWAWMLWTALYTRFAAHSISPSLLLPWTHHWCRGPGTPYIRPSWNCIIGMACITDDPQCAFDTQDALVSRHCVFSHKR